MALTKQESIDAVNALLADFSDIIPSEHRQTMYNIIDTAYDLNIPSDTAETGTAAVRNIVSLTQADYDALTPVSTTFYIITDV